MRDDHNFQSSKTAWQTERIHVPPDKYELLPPQFRSKNSSISIITLSKHKNRVITDEKQGNHPISFSVLSVYLIKTSSRLFILPGCSFITLMNSDMSQEGLLNMTFNSTCYLSHSFLMLIIVIIQQQTFFEELDLPPPDIILFFPFPG